MALSRRENPVPEDCAARLAATGLRVPYQGNDDLGWIARAKREETRKKRIAQMLSELDGATRCMKIRWRSRA